MKDNHLRSRANPGDVAAHSAIPAPLRVLFDASALAKRYADEAGHGRVLALIAQADELDVAAHCLTEVASALLRRRRDGSLPRAEFDRVWAAAQRDVADMAQVPVDDHVERFAFAALEHGPLRVTDALHLGSALAANVDLFVTADPRVAQVARLMGLAVECLDDEPVRAGLEQYEVAA